MFLMVLNSTHTHTEHHHFRTVIPPPPPNLFSSSIFKLCEAVTKPGLVEINLNTWNTHTHKHIEISHMFLILNGSSKTENWTLNPDLHLCRCGSRTAGPSGGKERNAGVAAAWWQNTACTGPWSVTPSHCLNPSSSQPRRVWRSRTLRGC